MARTPAAVEPLIWNWDTCSARLRVEWLAVSTLTAASSPRANELDPQHVEALVESAASTPPVIVHRPTMRVIDGRHRVEAARLRGDRTIAARCIDGDPDDLFALAVRANVTHGMPLTLAERKTAAGRLLTSHPQWSNRLIAATTGLSHKTVGTLRRHSSGADPQLLARVGQDGKMRPVDRSRGRAKAAELIRADPRAPLTQIAERAGLSVGTVRDVRDRLARGADPAPARKAPTPSVADRRPDLPGVERQERSAPVDRSIAITRLCRDPALRHNENGRALLRLLASAAGAARECESLTITIPSHSITAVAALAKQNAQSWAEFADRLESPDPAQVGAS